MEPPCNGNHLGDFVIILELFYSSSDGIYDPSGKHGCHGRDHSWTSAMGTVVNLAEMVQFVTTQSLVF